MKTGVDPSLLGLVGPFTKIARSMSSQWNVEIVPSGFRCETDGKRIYIPFTSDMIPEDKRQKLHGMLDHEVCHVVEEQEHEAVGRAKPTDILKGEPNRTMRLLLNVVEDIRIENKWSKVYPGVAENLNYINLQFAKDWEKDPSLKKNFWDRLGCAFVLKARGIEPTWLDAKTLEDLAKLDSELEDAKTISWCQDSYDIAERIFNKFKSEAEETREREEKKKKRKKRLAEGEFPGEPGESDVIILAGEAKAFDSPEHEESGPTDEESPAEEEDEGPTEDELARAEEIEEEATKEDASEATRGEMEEEVRDDAIAHDHYVPSHEMKKLDRWFKPSASPGAAENYRLARAEVQAQIGAIRGKQLAYIQTITRKRLVSNQDSGRLDTQRLAAVRNGATDVFNYIKKGRDLDTAIEVLIDLSGSMSDGDYKGTAAYYAKRTAIALAEAWDSLKIPNEFIGFSNNHHRGGGAVAEEGAVRRVPFDFYVFKAWTERLAPCRPRFAAIRGYGDNADGEAVHSAASRLVVRKEKRKILVVISDGVPCHGGIPFDKLNQHLKDTVKLVSRSGIEVIGVGAGTDAPVHFYNKETGATNMIVKDFTKLPTTLFTALRDKMLK